MKIAAKVLTICAATILLALPASADPNSAPSGQADPPSQNPALNKAQAQEFFRASKIVGQTAQDPEGRTIGDIKEIAFNKQGDILALVDVGSGRWAAVPWQLVNTGSAKGRGNITFATTAPAVKSAPVVSQDQWAALDDPDFTKGVYAYYHLQPPTATGGASSPGGINKGQGASGQPGH